MEMKYVTDEMLAQVINGIPDAIFDTHKVEQRMLREHPVAAAQQILEYRKNDDVLQQFSAVFSKRIATAFPGQVDKVQKVISANLGGRDSKNQQWRRGVAAIRAR
jgi:hypothetical protein